VSSLIEQLLCRLHIPPIGANPNQQQIIENSVTNCPLYFFDIVISYMAISCQSFGWFKAAVQVGVQLLNKTTNSLRILRPMSFKIQNLYVVQLNLISA